MEKSKTPPLPRSFGDIPADQRLGPVVGVGETPWGQAKHVPEIYCVVDHHSDGTTSVARFHDVGKAVELFETAELTIMMGTIKGCVLIGSAGEIIDQKGTLNEAERKDNDGER